MSEVVPFSDVKSLDDLVSLEESLDIVRDEELMQSLRRSRAEAASGERLRLKDHV